MLLGVMFAYLSYIFSVEEESTTDYLQYKRLRSLYCIQYWIMLLYFLHIVATSAIRLTSSMNQVSVACVNSLRLVTIARLAVTSITTMLTETK